MASGYHINLQKLETSRKKLHPGDVFIVQLADKTYRFGRVIRTDAKWTTIEAGGLVNLIYVYKYASTTREIPSREELRPDRLLIPPVLINRLGWSRGYMETIGNLPLDADDVLKPHCFFGRYPKRCYDEYGKVLPGPIELIGEWGVASYRVLDDEISAAVGIPLAPDGPM